MHSKGMYLGLQGTRILVGFLRVSAVVQQKACMYTIGANNVRAGEGRAGIGMRAPGSEQGRRGASRVMLAIREHAGTVVGERSFVVPAGFFSLPGFYFFACRVFLRAWFFVVFANRVVSISLQPEVGTVYFLVLMSFKIRGNKTIKIRDFDIRSQQTIQIRG